MSFYSVSRSNIALSTTVDAIQLAEVAARRSLVHEVSVSGLGTASAANELGGFRATTNGSLDGTAITPEKMIPDAPAFAGSTRFAPVTNATLSAVAILRLGVNANGGVYRWVAKPGQEIEIRTATAPDSQFCLRSATGTSSVSVHMIFEEM